MEDQKKFLTTVYTDGHGSYQGQCLHCDWRGKWYEGGKTADRQAKAAQDASDHGKEHAAALFNDRRQR